MSTPEEYALKWSREQVISCPWNDPKWCAPPSSPQYSKNALLNCEQRPTCASLYNCGHDQLAAGLCGITGSCRGNDGPARASQPPKTGSVLLANDRMPSIPSLVLDRDVIESDSSAIWDSSDSSRDELTRRFIPACAIDGPRES